MPTPEINARFSSSTFLSAIFPRQRHSGNAPKKPSLSLARLAQLEPRVLFDAALEQSIAAAGNGSAAEVTTDEQHNIEPEFHQLVRALDIREVTTAAPFIDGSTAMRHFSDPPLAFVEADGVSDVATASEQHEVVFIDSSLPDLDVLLADIGAGVDIHFIDPGSDGVEQIADVMSRYSNVSAIHIISHGTAGNLVLGTANLNQETIAGGYAQALSAIGAAMAENADLLIYGCNFADGSQGAGAVAALATITRADVAASVDVTGASGLGGNWLLEQRTGAIETRLVSGMDWQHTLLLSNTGSWTTSGLSNTNVTQGITATIGFSAISPQSSVVITGNETFATGTFFANGADGDPSLRFVFNWDTTPESVGSSPPIVLPPASGDGGTATLTITFSQPVTNPIIHLDRLGGNMSYDPNTSIPGDEISQSNSALFTLTTPGATLTDLAVPTDVSHFVVTSTTIQRTPFVNQSYSPAPSAEAATNINSTAAGSVRVNGTFTTLTFVLSGVGPEGAGGDGIEIGLALDAPPDARNDAFTINEDTTLTGNLFANNGSGADTDPTSDAFTVTQINGAPCTVGTPIALANGTLTITNVATGAFTFVPNANYFGPATFNYTIADANGGTDTATVNITVTDVNDPPVATPSTSSGTEDSNIPVDLSGTDVDGTIASVKVTTLPPPAQGVLYLSDGVTPVTAGAPLSPSQAATLIFIPATNFNGTVTIPFTVTDDDGATSAPANEVITVTPVNDPPVDGDESNSTLEDTPLTVSAGAGLLANTVDPDGPAVTVTGFTVTGVPGTPTLGVPFTIPGKGDITINSNGSYSFVPALNYNGPIPQITYTVSDGTLTDTSTLNLSVTPVNDPPIDGDESNSTSEDTPLTVSAGAGLLVNSTDVDGGSPIITGFSVAGVPGTPTLGVPFTIPGKGDITINADGSYSFVPALNYNGPIPQITYTVSDGAGGTDTSTLDLSVTPVNDPPVDGDESNSTLEDTPLTVSAGAGLLANTVDPDGPAVTVTGFTVTGVPGTPTLGVPFTIPGKGDITINSNGSYSFVPALNYNGPIPQITYTVSDGTLTDTSTLNLSVTPVNDPPIDGDESNSTSEDTPLTVSAGAGLLANTVDPDGPAATVTGYTVTGVPGTPTLGVPFTIPGKGDITINADGSYSFVPALNYNGPIPQITYTVSDGAGGTDTSTLDLSVTPVNDPPVVVDPINPGTPLNPIEAPDPDNIIPDITTTDGASPADPIVSQYFADPEGDGLSFSVVDLPPGLTMNPDGTIVGAIDPDASQGGNVPGQPGVYLVTITADDGHGGVATTTVTYTVGNPPPVAVDDVNTVIEDTPVSGNVLTDGVADHDTAPDADPLMVTQFSALGDPAIYPAGSMVTIPGVGTLVINADGSYTFTPSSNYDGPVPVATYTISDGQGGTDTADLTLSITPVNDPPVIIDPANPGSDPRNPVPADPATIIPVQHVTDGAAFTPGTPLVDVSDYAADPDGDPLTFTTTSPLPVGLTLNPDGTVTGTVDPAASQGGDPGQPGVYTITVMVSDGVLSSPVTLVIDVSNLPPVANSDSGVAGEDGPPLTGNVITDAGPGQDHDTAPDNDPLTVVSALQGVNPISIGVPFATAGGGVLSLNADGSYSFDPGLAYNGLDDGETATETISYTISDGNGGTSTATLTITINGSNDAPVIVDPANPGPDPTNPLPADPATIVPAQTVTDGQSFPPGSPLVALAPYVVDPDGEPVTFTTTSPLPAGLTLNPDGTITGTVDASASQGGDPGQPGVYIVTVLVNDGSATTPMTVVIDVSDPPPVAVDDVNTVIEDTPVSGNVLTDGVADHDTAPDADPLTVASFDIPGVGTTVAGGTANIPGVGMLQVNPDGTYTFTPAPNYDGPVPVVTYTISDGNGGTDTGTLTLTIAPANDAPVVIDPTNPGTPLNPIEAPDPDNIIPDIATSDGASPADPIVSQYFADPEGDGLSFSAVDLPPGLTMNPDGTIVGAIDPDASQGGNVPGQPGVYLVTITADDGHGGVATTTVTYTVANPPPVAVDDVNTVIEDTPVSGNVLTDGVADHDTAPDADPLTVVSFDIPGVGTTAAGGTANIPGVGTLVISADGSYTFTPSSNYDGPVPVATYTISDGNGGTDTADLTLTITPVNDPPVVVDPVNPGTPLNPIEAPDPDNIIPDIATTDGASPADPIVSQYFADPDGDGLSFSAVDLPPGLIMNPDGTIIGVIDLDASQGGNVPGQPGVYLVTITADDGHGGVATTTVTYTVANPPPVAVDDHATGGTEDAPQSGNVLTDSATGDHDAAPDSDLLAVTAVAGGTVGAPIVLTYGALKLNADGSWTFTPNALANALPVGALVQEVVTYTIADGNGGTDMATLTIDINGVNDVPTSTPLPNAEGSEGSPLMVPTAGVFHDVDTPDVLTYTATGLPPGLAINPVTGVISGTPTVGSGGHGPYTIVVTADDGHGGTVTSMFELKINVPAGGAEPPTPTPLASRSLSAAPLPVVSPIVIPAVGSLDGLGSAPELGLHAVSDAVNGLGNLNGSVDFGPGDAVITKLVAWAGRQGRDAAWLHALLDSLEHAPYAGDSLGLALSDADQNLFTIKTLVRDGVLFIGVDELADGADVLHISDVHGDALPDNVVRAGVRDLIVNITPDARVLMLAVTGRTPVGRNATWHVNVVIQTGEILIGDAPNKVTGLGHGSRSAAGLRDAMVRALTG